MRELSFTIRSMLAGMMIGIGGFAYLSCDSKVVGALLFSIGLISVIVFRLPLFTGKVCQPVVHNLEGVFELLLCLISNLLGACLASLLSYSESLSGVACVVMSAKSAKDWPQLFLGGMMCEVCIAFAVKGYRLTRSLVMPILGVATFVLTGSEHCVADFFYMMSADGHVPLGMLLTVIAGNTVGGLMMMGVGNAEREGENKTEA